MSDQMEIDVFWSFRSPWSCLATPRLREWQETYDLKVNFRVVYPTAIRNANFFNEVNPLWRSYFMTDLSRVAEYLNLPMVWPEPDPINQEMKDGKIITSGDQPLARRLTYMGVVAEEKGRGIEFADEASRLIFGGTKNWHQGDHLAKAAKKAGLDPEQMDAIVESEADRLESVVQNNQQDHEKAGHWGVPTCVFKGEPFFGQDRLDVLLWRLQQQGLKEKTASSP